MKKRQLPYQTVILVCGGDKCSDRKSKKLFKNIEEEIERRKLDDSIRAVRTECMGKCDDGPNVVISPGALWICGAKSKDAKKILDELLDSGVASDPTEI
jgi:NADP-reducing hydrogenase subunit HndC